MQGELPSHNPSPKPLSFLVVSVLLAMLVGIVYCNSISRELVFDSATIIGEDPRIRELSGETLHSIFTEQYWWPNMPSSAYRPLTTLSFLVNYAVLGNATNPTGYQIVNIALHWCAACLVFLLGLRLGLSRLASLGAAALFAVHPIATEGVVNIVGRGDQFATLAVLGCTLLAFDARRDTWTWKRASLFTAICVVGILAKENAIVLLPVVAMVGIFAPRNPAHSEIAKRRAPISWWWPTIPGLGAMLAIFLTARWWFTMVKPGGFIPFVDNPIVATDWLAGRLTALRVLFDGALSVFAPFSLSADYSFNQIPIASGGFANSSDAFGWLALVAGGFSIIVLARLWMRGGSAAAFGWGAAIVCVMPTANLLMVIGSIRADRFLYLPLAFIALGAAASIAGVSEKMKRTAAFSAIRPRLAFVLFVWCGALAVLAHMRTYDWRDNVVLWQATVVTSPNSQKAHQNLGVVINNRAADSRDKVLQAILHLETSRQMFEERHLHFVPLNQRADRTYVSLGSALANLAKLEEQDGHPDVASSLRERAEQNFREGIQISDAVRTRFSESLRKMGVREDRIPATYGDRPAKGYAEYLLSRGRSEEALALLRPLIELQPFDNSVRVLAAKCAADAARWDEALDDAMWALANRTEDAEALEIATRSLGKILPLENARPVTVLRNSRPTLNLDNKEVASRLIATLAKVHAYFLGTRNPVAANRIERRAFFDYGFDAQAWRTAKDREQNAK